jgi:hypothetical protein
MPIEHVVVEKAFHYSPNRLADQNYQIEMVGFEKIQNKEFISLKQK